MHVPSKILVPVDFSESSRAALDYAAVLAERLGAELDVLHVWRPEAVPSSSVELLSDFAQSDPGHKMIEWLTACDERTFVTTHGRIAAADRAEVPDAIVDVVESGAYDLIVMGASQHGLLTHLFKGSTAEKVRQRAPCPVVTVRAPDDDVQSIPPAENDVTVPWNWLS